MITKLIGNGGVTVNVAETAFAFKVPVIVETTVSRTGLVEIEKLATDDPAGIVTFVGRMVLELLAFNETMVPPTGAGPSSDTVPVAETPPRTELGSIFRPAKDAGITVKVALTKIPPELAEMLSRVMTATGVVEMVKSAEAAPPGTVIVAGGIELGSLELNATTTPPVGANPVRVTVPVATDPPRTD